MDTLRGEIFDLSARLLPEIFDRIAFERGVERKFRLVRTSPSRSAPETSDCPRGSVGVREEDRERGDAPRSSRSFSLPLGTALVMPYGAARLNGKIAS